MRLEEKLLNNRFSHIYVEKDAFKYEMCKSILEGFKNSKVIEIEDYKEVFSKNNQNFELQKRTPKLILAVKKDGFIYEGAKVCESFGNENFYYTSSVLNCIYDCEYCYLQGVYSSANIVVFVNVEEIFNHVENILKEKSMYICISYDTDLLALENKIGLVKKWYDFVRKHKNLKIELRTKSSNIVFFKGLEANKNFIVAWTISPQEVALANEKGTPNFQSRISCAKKLIESGWSVRICFDPVIKVENFEKVYAEMIDKTFDVIDGEKILDVSIGTFRISKEYLKRMKKNRGNSKVLFYPFECSGGVYSYGEIESKKMIEFMKKNVMKYVEEKKIFI